MLSFVWPFFNSIFYANSDFAVGAIGLILLVELVAGLLLLRGERAYWGRVLLFMVLFSLVIPIMVIILAAGICLIIFSGAGSL